MSKVTMKYNESDFERILKNSKAFKMSFYYDGIDKIKEFHAVSFTKGGHIVSGNNHSFSFIDAVETEKDFMLDRSNAVSLFDWFKQDAVDTIELTDTDLIIQCNGMEIALPLLRNGDGGVETRIPQYDTVISDCNSRDYDNHLTFFKKDLKAEIKRIRKEQVIEMLVSNMSDSELEHKDELLELHQNTKNNFIYTNTAFMLDGSLIFEPNLSDEQIISDNFKLVNAKLLNTIVTKITSHIVTVEFKTKDIRSASGVVYHTPFILTSGNITTILMPLRKKQDK